MNEAARQLRAYDARWPGLCAALALVALTACSSTKPLPWIHGIEDVVSSIESDEPALQLDSEPEPGCSMSAAQPVKLVADIGLGAGREIIVGTFSGGLSVFDRKGRLVLRTKGFPCEGSYDELEVVATGSVYGTRALAIVVTAGGHRETATWVHVYRVDGAMTQIFSGIVETRDGEDIQRGAVYLFPGGALYRPPGEAVDYWRTFSGFVGA